MAVAAAVAASDAADPDAAPPALKCAVCLSGCVQPCVSRCGHLACRGCWDAVLSMKQECPVCRALVRAKFLTPLYPN